MADSGPRLSAGSIIFLLPHHLREAFGRVGKLRGDEHHGRRVVVDADFREHLHPEQPRDPAQPKHDGSLVFLRNVNAGEQQ